MSHVSSLLGATDKGYRVLSNIGSDGGQEVPHLHFHIFAGEKKLERWLLNMKKVQRYFLDYEFSKNDKIKNLKSKFIKNYSK